MVNEDGTVTLKSTGKLAATPKSTQGSTATRPAAYKGTSAGGAAPVVRKQPGRGPVPKSAAAH